jgi:hypothetical protein
MSWASRRSTTRVEDRAYSLLGIFDINMPLLYGEGRKAFRRLQEEIIRTSNDRSIFAFGRDKLLSVEESMYEREKPMYPPKVIDTVLAESPDYFWQGGDVLMSKDLFDEPYSVTHMGLRLMARSYKALRPDWLKPSGMCYAIWSRMCIDQLAVVSLLGSCILSFSRFALGKRAIMFGWAWKVVR